MKLTLNKVLSILGGLIGFAALFLFLAAPLQTPAAEIFGQTIPAQPWDYNVVFFGNDTLNGAIGAFIGFILMGVGGLIGVASAFGKKSNKILVLISIIITIVGAVLVFLTKTLWLGANDTGVSIPGIDLSKGVELAVGTIIGGIMGIASAIIMLVSLIIPNKKASKKRRK